MTRVVVHIDRLVVNGGGDGRRIEAAVKEAIGHELARPGALDTVLATGNRTMVDAGRVPQAAGPGGLGAAIGRSVTGRGSR